MHLKEITLLPEKYPVKNIYPYSLEIFNATGKIVLNKPVTFFTGENGSGKSTLLRAIAHRCGIHLSKSRYRIKGLYLLDEPENALSPKKQLELLKILNESSQAGHAQFIIATHSPILLALPEACIYSFDHIPIKPVQYEETEYYQIYRDFLNDRDKYLKLI
ncbi:MAG: AAA family ATPase [Actinobacteria bacterium]|nr:AAA family ATPase [Actinomycetota bacterium]